MQSIVQSISPIEITQSITMRSISSTVNRIDQPITSITAIRECQCQVQMRHQGVRMLRQHAHRIASIDHQISAIDQSINLTHHALRSACQHRSSNAPCIDCPSHSDASHLTRSSHPIASITQSPINDHRLLNPASGSTQLQLHHQSISPNQSPSA